MTGIPGLTGDRPDVGFTSTASTAPGPQAIRPRHPGKGRSTFVVVKTETCQWCQVAVQFLEKLQETKGGFQIKVVDANAEPDAFRAIAGATRRTSVPQIFLDGGFVGGWSELVRAAKSGQLDAYLDGEDWKGKNG